jgi:hypothetical protein
MCERGHDSSTPPAPSPTSTTSNSDERIRGSAVICHLSLPLPLHISKPFPPPASCLTPARRAPWRSMKQQSPLVCLCSIPTTSLLHGPAAPPRATRWALLLPISLSVPPTSSSCRRLCTHSYRVRRPSGVRRAFSSNSCLALPSLIETCSRRAWALRDWNWKMNVSQA